MAKPSLLQATLSPTPLRTPMGTPNILSYPTSTPTQNTTQCECDSIFLPLSQEEFNVSCLTDSNADTYWESDGSQCQHWVRLTMKKGTIVK